MPTVVARPDLLYALGGWLRSFSDLTALVSSSAGWKTPGTRSGPRISSEIQGGPDGWNMPTRAIVLRKAGGPVIGDDYTMGLKRTRIDTHCYVATGLEADGVWAMLDAVLVPEAGLRSASFVQNGVHIVDVIPEADATARTDQDTGWRSMWAPYVVLWRAVGP
jgi:hypothetical protein